MLWLLLFLALGITIVLVGRWYTSRHLTKYSAEEASTAVSEGRAVFLDVRTAQERSAKAIPDSLHIPLGELSARIGELEAYRDREVIAYCRTGTRSMAAADILHKGGFRSANLTGGMLGSGIAGSGREKSDAG